MIILGIDPGTAITGFGVIEVTGQQISFKDGGVVRTEAKVPAAARLATIYREISQVIKEHHPAVMAVELLYFATNVTTAMAVSQARGVVLLAAAQQQLKVAEYTPLQVKQALTNYGRADKQQMQAAVKSLLRLSELPRPDDAADALAIAICHSASLAP